MNKHDEIYDVPNLTCPQCKEPLDKASGVTPGATPTLKKGQLFICAHCALVCRVGDSSLIPLNESEFNKLDTQTQRSVAITVAKLKQGMAGRSN